MSLAALAFAACAVLALAGNSFAGPSGRLPEVRLGAGNAVPVCVTPARLMRFLSERNAALDPRYRRIAAIYRQHGEANRVRWDYAFFQMLVETNYLTFRKDVPETSSPRRTTSHGIGTTGGGVPGDSYLDVSTGVLAQIQHLMVYSGERLDAPVAPRTRDKQDDIIAQSRRLGRQVTFQDLAGRWAADRRYGRTLSVTADRFFGAHCNGPDTEPDEDRTPAARGDVVAHSGGGTIARPASVLIGAAVGVDRAAGPRARPLARRPKRGVRATPIMLRELIAQLCVDQTATKHQLISDRACRNQLEIFETTERLMISNGRRTAFQAAVCVGRSLGI